MVVSLASRAAAGAFVLAALAAQQTPPAAEAMAAAFHLDRLCVKLAEGCGAELRDGVLAGPPGVDLGAVAALFAEAEAEPLVTAVPREQLDRWHAEACTRLPAHNRPGNLGLWFRLRGEPAQLAALAERLRTAALVEHVLHEPRLYPASAGPLPGGDLPPTTPLFTHLQHSHGPPPVGHGVREASSVHGARGAGVNLMMMEESYLLGHEDVCQLVASSFLGPVPPYDPLRALHGLSGAGIVCADRNGYGLTGIADEVVARFGSIDLNGGIVNALTATVAQTQPGDVILIVMMVLLPQVGAGGWVPFEYYQPGFDATLTATALGRHVVVPAGNGNFSLDDPVLLNRFDRAWRDSGAIIVGASSGAALQRAPYCTWGSRVDAHSWGDGVASCGYGTLFFPNNDPLQSYTTAATGTSSATPHLAGIVAAMQGAAKRQLGRVLDNAEVLALLHAHGPSTPDAIGRRPDLPAILRAIGAIDGLVVDAGDVGIGGTRTVTMEGPANALATLFGSLRQGQHPLGVNRPLLLDAAGTHAIGGFVLANGSASWQLVVPADPALHDTDVYFQAVRLHGAQPMHVTNSCHVTIL